MNFFKSLFLASMLMISSAYADGFGINLGPFSLQLGGYGGDFIVSHRNIVDQPICFAIDNHKRLVISIEGVEIVSSKEKKIISKQILVEPYAFGVTRDGKPVLNGNIVEEKLIREVSVKFGEDRFDEPNRKSNENGNFTGVISSDKKNIDISKVVQIDVVDDSHFDAPKDYKGVNDDNIRVICQLPITEK